ncbi:MAG: carboxypeptidase regulatory-like domain-containing protein [Planctomycetia bacterium]|nr:carboxypeptidase regulatory-like domain-containing protein [Planctomycetia bacterium]
MTPRQRTSVPRRRAATLALLVMFATMGAVRGPARAEDAPSTAPPAPKAAPAADPAAVAPLVEQGEAPWPDLAALTRWFDETCTVVEEIVGEKFQRRPTLRVVTRWELELVLREAPLPANPSAEAIAQRFRTARDTSLWRSFTYDRRAHVVCFAPANRDRPRADGTQVPFPDRLWCVTELTIAWQAERFEWARAAAPTGFEEATSLEAVRAGHARWVAELASRRWGAPGVVDRLIAWFLQWDHRPAFVPWVDGFEFFRRVFDRAGNEGVRRALTSPPRRLRDIDAPDGWLHPPPSPPPYLDLWSVADALLAPLPRTAEGRSRPRVGEVVRGTMRPPRAEDVPVDAIRDARVDGDRHLDVAILQFRDAAAANRFAAAATAEAPTASLVDYWTIPAAIVESVEDGAGLDRRARGFTIRRQRVVDDFPTRFHRGGDVVVGPIVGRVHWTGPTASGPDADGLLAALESRLRALLRGEAIEPVAAYPVAAEPAGPQTARDQPPVVIDVLVRRPDGTPVVGADVGWTPDTPSSSTPWPEDTGRTGANGRCRLRLASPTFPLRIEAEPPPELDTLAAAATTVTDASPIVLTLAEGWVATGRVTDGARAVTDGRVIALTGGSMRPFNIVDCDDDGTFRVRHLPSGPVALRAVGRPPRRDHPTSEFGVATSASPVVALERTLSIASTEERVRLRVRGPEGAPSLGSRAVTAGRDTRARVSVMPPAGTEDPEVRFDARDRRVTVFGSVLADGRRLAPRTVTVPVAPVDPLVVDLELAVVTSGRVLDAEGRGVAGARVEGGVLGAPWAATEAVTDASGAFRLDGLAAGPCWLTVASVPAPHTSAAAVRAVAGASDVVLRVGTAADVVISVLGSAGAPVAGADVTFTAERGERDRDGRPSVFRATSDAAGRATLPAVPTSTVGKLEVRPTHANLAAIVRRGTRLRAAESIQLPAAYTVTGRVARDGSTSTGAFVSLMTRSVTAPETWLDVRVETGRDGTFAIPQVPMGRARLRLQDRIRSERRPTLRYEPIAMATPDQRDVVLRPSNFTDVVFTMAAAAGRTLHLRASGPDPAVAELTADANGRFEWIEAADVPHELWIPPTPEDPRVAYLPDYVPGPTPPTLMLTAPGVARFRRPAFEGGQVDGATVEDAWVVGPMGMAFAARSVAEGRFEVDGLPPGTFPAVVRVRTGKGWVRCSGPVTVGAPEVELPRP